MTDYPPKPSQLSKPAAHSASRWILIGLYVLLTLIILILSLMLAMKSTIPVPPLIILPTSPSRTPSATITPTATKTLTPTRHPTFTPEPSSTASITLTPTSTPSKTAIPTLTPAFPLPTNEIYRLQSWTPEQAERLIRLMESYPDSLSAYARGEDDAGYYAAYRYAVLTQQEALLRFPNTPFAQQWLWRLAYNLAQMGDPHASQQYALIIADQLNHHRLRLGELEQWGLAQEPAMNIELIPIRSQAGIMSSVLIKVGAQEHGAAVIWLVETPQKYESFALSNDFDFLHPTDVSISIGDLTNDGIDEVIISRSPIPGSMKYPLPRIFSLSQTPPLELSFAPVNPPEVGPNFRNHWLPVTQNSGQTRLQFTDTLFPPCPVIVKHLYTWNGRAFEWLDVAYEVQPIPALLNYCEIVVPHAIQVWGLQATTRIMETLLPLWPPQKTTDGNPYPSDALDKWRYRLGLYHALMGNYTTSEGYFQGIIANPVNPISPWVAAAKQFLQDFREPKDIYASCLRAPLCEPRLAFQSLIRLLNKDDFAMATDFLTKAGVTVRSSGYFDFQKDGTTERWIILRHKPMEKLEFWIISNNPDGFHATFVDFMETNQPKIIYADTTSEPPIIQISPNAFFRFYQPMNYQEPFTTFAHLETSYSTGLTQRTLDEIETRLLSGYDPQSIRGQLSALANSPYFTCDYLNCPRYYYLVGLVNELLGNERGAVDAYLELWRKYFHAPYTTMARLKLAGIVLPPSPTPTMTPSITLTPTITGTIPTHTPTMTGTLPTSTPTRTITPTPTLTPYGYPF